MQILRSAIPAALLVLAGLEEARADDNKALVPGDPPLTQQMVDDYGKLAEWRLGPAVARVGSIDRLAQMIVNDWKNGDKARQQAILADLRWWREDFPKLTPAQRDRLAGKAPAPGADPERVRMSAREIEAIHLLQLQQQNNARQQQIRALSNLQAEHHELMMIIIGNLRPTGRYVYNPSTGRYDRYLSD